MEVNNCVKPVLWNFIINFTVDHYALIYWSFVDLLIKEFDIDQ